MISNTYNLIDGTKDLVDLAKRCLILKEDRGIELWDFFMVEHFEDHVILRRVHICSIFYKEVEESKFYGQNCELKGLSIGRVTLIVKLISGEA